MDTRHITICLAQAPVIKGAVEENLKIHLSYISESSNSGADVVVFPELSLTGYELELAEKLAFQQEPNNFKKLSKASVDNCIIIIAGCPLVVEKRKPAIGAVICFPNGKTEFYLKQYLHEGEDTYFSSGVEDYFISFGGYSIALAICADFSNPKHSADAVKSGAEIYIASALISESGYSTDAHILSNIASEYKIPVLLSNHVSNTGGWTTCGKNAVWDSSGKFVVSSYNKENCLVLCTFSGDTVTGSVRKVKTAT
ncbi:carbon-nitrogen hydrolase family protein [Halomonas sp. WWR20]